MNTLLTVGLVYVLVPIIFTAIFFPLNRKKKWVVVTDYDLVYSRSGQTKDILGFGAVSKQEFLENYIFQMVLWPFFLFVFIVTVITKPFEGRWKKFWDGLWSLPKE